MRGFMTLGNHKYFSSTANIPKASLSCNNISSQLYQIYLSQSFVNFDYSVKDIKAKG